MSIKIKSLLLKGVEAQLVEIESKLFPGLNKFSIVGLPDRSINEAKERILGALLSVNQQHPEVFFPYGQLIVNLYPAFLEKAGTGLDLALCTSILLQKSLLETDVKLELSSTVFIGELGLDGSVRSIAGGVALVMEAAAAGFKRIVLPAELYSQTNFIGSIDQLAVANVYELIRLLRTGKAPKLFPPKDLRAGQDLDREKHSAKIDTGLLLVANRPQELRVLTIAAAGGHNLLLDGAPGSGKTTMLSKFSALLPPLNEKQSLETYKLHSLAGAVQYEEFLQPLQRSPHHSISDVALIGGGKDPTPGEITLAHNGVLFLDEMAEFSGYALEALRQPLTEKCVAISRAKYKVVFPANFQLVATRNPCHCGWYGSGLKRCKCPAAGVINYQNKLSGALLDRIDIKYRVPNLKNYRSKLSSAERMEIIRSAKASISAARKMQGVRYADLEIRPLVGTNAHYNNPLALDVLQLAPAAYSEAVRIHNMRKLSLRSSFKILLLARTIADLERSEKVLVDHVLEAFTYNYWQ